MLLTSVIFVLREVLEASMLISVLLALSAHWRQGFVWVFWSVLVGSIGTLLFASFLHVVTDSFEGAGQELTNVSLQGVSYFLILAIVALSPFIQSHKRLMSVFMAVAVSCAMTREGSEILIYIMGFASVPEQAAAVYAGSAIGGGIGISLGVLLFSALRSVSEGRVQLIAIVLISLMGAGTIMQASMLLEQIDWLPMGQALWDSSGVISEQSVAGELLYAVFGYEATPSVTQAVLYMIALALMFVSYWVASGQRGRPNVA